MKSKDKSTVPYDDDHNAAFYRLPAGIRRAQKEIEKEEDGKRTSVCFSSNSCHSKIAPYSNSLLNSMLFSQNSYKSWELVS